MGKGSNTTTTNQSQTYAPAGAGYVQNALQQGQNAASLPFNIPQAPVAGFSQDQQNAFQNVNNAQGMAQPYFNQANQYFQQSAQGPNVSQFFNPYAGAVTDQLKNIFGQQNSQNTGQLTQAAGGVGADRIAVGQSQLANQQGLAAGQTLAGLYAPSLQAAQNQQNILQSAGYGTAALGSQAQNAALSGAQAQLGTGGLQQQLSQAQLNSPYQQQLAQAAFPYQQAQFLAGITGSLAPGLGGTTTGQGQTTTPAPSLWSQLIGGGTAATGLLGQTGAFGNNGWLSGNKGSGGSNYASQPLTGQDAWQNSQLFPGYGTAAQGGAVYPYAEGGSVSDEPIDVAPQSIIPTGAQTPHIQDHIPQLNLNPPQQQSGGGGGGGGLGDVMKLAAMFMARGGAASPYADGGLVKDQTRYGDDAGNPLVTDKDNEYEAHMLLGPTWSGAYPEQKKSTGPSRRNRISGPERVKAGFYEGGNTGVINPDEPYRMTPQEDVQNWRDSVDADMASGRAHSPTKQLITGSDQPSPLDTANWPYGPVGGPSDAAGAVNQFAGSAPPSQGGPELAFAGDGAGAPASGSPYSPPAAAAQSDDGTGGFNKFIKSPWAALTAAGLGIMGGTSPYAGVNIGQGAMQGLKMLEQQREGSQKDETIKQAAKRLDIEAKHYEDQLTKMTPYQTGELANKKKELEQKAEYQKYEMAKPVPGGQTIGPLGLPMTTFVVPDGKGGFTPVQAPTGDSDNPVKNIVEGIKAGTLPPDTTGMNRLTPAIKSALSKDGFDLTRAQLEMAAAKKQILSLNGPQMVRFAGLASSVDKTIDEVNSLAGEMKNSGIPLINQAKIAELIHLEGNSPKGQLAAKYVGAVNTLKEEFANLANGGYAPTEPAWKLANEQINGNYGVLQLGASLGEVQRLIRYRLQGIPNMGTLGPGTTNRYVPSGAPSAHGAAPAAAPPAAPAAAAPPGAAPAPTPGATVKQNGHTYERQPDGSYKAVD